MNGFFCLPIQVSLQRSHPLPTHPIPLRLFFRSGKWFSFCFTGYNLLLKFPVLVLSPCPGRWRFLKAESVGSSAGARCASAVALAWNRYPQNRCTRACGAHMLIQREMAGKPQRPDTSGFNSKERRSPFQVDQLVRSVQALPGFRTESRVGDKCTRFVSLL